MNNRDKLGIIFFALGLSGAGVGVAIGSHYLTFAGLFAIAVTVRYRKKPPFWDYLAFLVLALVIVALVPPSSPLIGAIPLLLSYVLDYIDERRQKRAALSKVALAPGIRPAAPRAAQGGGPAAPADNARLTTLTLSWPSPSTGRTQAGTHQKGLISQSEQRARLASRRRHKPSAAHQFSSREPVPSVV